MYEVASVPDHKRAQHCCISSGGTAKEVAIKKSYMKQSGKGSGRQRTNHSYCDLASGRSNDGDHRENNDVVSLKVSIGQKVASLSFVLKLLEEATAKYKTEKSKFQCLSKNEFALYGKTAIKLAWEYYQSQFLQETFTHCVPNYSNA